MNTRPSQPSPAPINREPGSRIGKPAGSPMIRSWSGTHSRLRPVTIQWTGVTVSRRG
jgi:hypothetical protein